MDTLTSRFNYSFSLTTLSLSLRDVPFCRAQPSQKPQLRDLTAPWGIPRGERLSVGGRQVGEVGCYGGQCDPASHFLLHLTHNTHTPQGSEEAWGSLRSVTCCGDLCGE